MKKEEILFPYPKIREHQDQVIQQVQECLKNKTNLIMHAPTGLGKTIATLGPALAHAIKKDITIFFLTSRHTQHKIVIDTLKLIKDKYNIEIPTVDIVGKKWMCPVPGTDQLYSNEFTEYCKSQREEGKCEFYTKTKDKSGKPTPEAKKLMFELISPCSTEKVIEICTQEKLCPYEISTLMANKAKVIVCDYYYIFHPSIKKTFFAKTGKKIENSIIIIDEAHNLPLRMRELLSQRLTNFMLTRAIKEAKKYDYNETVDILKAIKDILINMANKIIDKDQMLITKQDFTTKIKLVKDYQELIADLTFIADDIREKQKQSYIGSIASFLEAWLGEDEGFARILTQKETKSIPLLTLSYRCLDPSLLTKNMINESYSTIAMSGTLTPTQMYKDILGFEKPTQKRFESPFPKKNRLNLIIPETSTKFTLRNSDMYKHIAVKCAQIVNNVPGNCAIFFPSYYLRNEINQYFTNICKKTTFLEEPGLSKKEKLELLEKFKEYKNHGAVILGISSGSFGEGIDLPGDLLKCVVVVGLPLQKPDLETQEQIKYYDKLFQKGWDYGYLFPAFNKCLQSAGRCIRSETDRGIVIFLDQRFTWKNYFRCFPLDIDLKITIEPVKEIKEFFS